MKKCYKNLKINVSLISSKCLVASLMSHEHHNINYVHLLFIYNMLHILYNIHHSFLLVEFKNN